MKRGLYSTIGSISLIHFFSHFFLMTLPPIFPFILEDFPSLSYFELGLIVSMLSLSRLFFQFPIGILVDTVEVKYVLIFGSLLSSMSVCLLGFAPNYYFLLIFSFLVGVGQSTIHPADYAIMTSITDTSQEGKFFGVHTFVGMIGWAVAPITMTFLSRKLSWNVALLVIGTVSAVLPLIQRPVRAILRDLVEGQLMHGRLTTTENLRRMGIILKKNLARITVLVVVKYHK